MKYQSLIYNSILIKKARNFNSALVVGVEVSNFPGSISEQLPLLSRKAHITPGNKDQKYSTGQTSLAILKIKTDKHIGIERPQLLNYFKKLSNLQKKC